MAEEPEPQLIFVVGYPRSGTTLFAVQLANRLGAAVTPETFFMHRVPASVVGANSEMSPSEVSALIASTDPDDEFWMQAAEAASSAGVASGTDSTRPSALFSRSLALFAARSQTGVVIEKTPMHLWWSHTLLQWFPTALVVHVTRDGRQNSAARTRTSTWTAPTGTRGAQLATGDGSHGSSQSRRGKRPFCRGEDGGLCGSSN